VLRGLLVPLEGECSELEQHQLQAANGMISDAFTKRETASEELYIRQEEKAKYVHAIHTALRSFSTPIRREGTGRR
jgi:hypothetical protein